MRSFMNYSPQRILLNSLNIIETWERRRMHNANILLVWQP
jgi:hypothetical protein